MKNVMNKYEYMIMWCASQKKREFDIEEMQAFLRELGEKKLGAGGLQIYLNRLVKKKLLKKKYVRIFSPNCQTRYRSLCTEDFFLGHIKNLDLENEEEREAWGKEIERKRKAGRRMAESGIFIAEEGYYTQEEREKIREAIDQLPQDY